jgi:hypothetical protein
MLQVYAGARQQGRPQPVQKHAPPQRTHGGCHFDVHHLEEVFKALGASTFAADLELLLRLGARMASETQPADGGAPVAGDPTAILAHYLLLRRLLWCE